MPSELSHADRLGKSCFAAFTLLTASWTLAHLVFSFSSAAYTPLATMTPSVWSAFVSLWAKTFSGFCLLSLVASIILWRRTGVDYVLSVLTGMNLLTTSLSVIPFAFRPRGIEYTDVALVTVIIIVAGLCFAGAFRVCERPHWLDRIWPLGPKITGACVILATAIFILYFSILCVYRCRALIPDLFDLSWENQAVWSAFHAWPMWSTVGHPCPYFMLHTPYIYFILGLPHLLYPDPTTLVVVQAVVLGLGSPIFYLFCRALGITRQASLLLSLVYLLHPSLQGMAMYDLHSSPLAIPFVFLMCYGLVARRPWWLILGALLTLAAREELAMIVAAIGLYGCLTRCNTRWSVVLFVGGAAFFFVNTKIIMPYFGANPNMGGNLLRFVELLGTGYKSQPLTQLVAAFFGQPLRVLHNLLTWPRIEYLLIMSLPMAGLCWLGGWRSWILLVPGIFITLFSHHLTHHQYTYQYSTMLLAGVMLTSALGCRRLQNVQAVSRYFGSYLLVIGFAALSANYLYGSLFAKTYKLQFIRYDKPLEQLTSPVIYGRTVHCSMAWPKVSPEWAMVKEAQRLIPAQASVRVEDRHLHPWFSSRRIILSLDQAPEEKADFVLLTKSSREKHAPSTEYEAVLRNSRFTLYRRTIREVSPGGFKAYSCDNSDPLGTQYSMDVVRIIPNGDFECGALEHWEASGDAFLAQPIQGDTAAARGKPAQPQGRFWIGTYERRGDAAYGVCTSEAFQINVDVIAFLLGGGSTKPMQEVQLLDADNQRVLLRASPTGCRDRMVRHYFDVRPFHDRRCRIRIVDPKAKGCSHINVDDFVGLRYPPGCNTSRVFQDGKQRIMTSKPSPTTRNVASVSATQKTHSRPAKDNP